ncbi:hypothetical protein CYLTODRAFT_491868 [Cylindrobasidium torrendii FP15055 ss-10]|uniref:Uncharacterized protein n=1 Tax=Cylindrobasidium torrendii FP15055 ss-10 TaxID=1314674 RepID=A0A0D7B6X2_9AGAR|nr:hypothetical protein CYLTODRAFT_491868 [Cylindrobasidium torrendii FP15055 ss-10]
MSSEGRRSSSPFNELPEPIFGSSISNAASTSSKPLLRLCYSCRKELNDDENLKSCLACRMKMREYNKKKTEKRRQARQELVTHANMTVDEKIRHVKNSFNPTTSQGNDVTPPTPTGITCLDFNGLSQTIRAKTTNTESYALIKDPESDHKKITWEVARNLAKTHRVYIHYKNPIYKKARQDSYTRQYACTCHLSNVHPHAAAFGKAPPSCTGTITFISQDDSSHPEGIPGQRITVTISHP